LDDIVRVERLNAGYGRFQTLFDVSVSIPRGGITAIVGPNGAGKSTLLKTIFGLTRVYSGRVYYEGRDITRMPPHERARLGMAYIPQLENVFRNLTIWENLRLAGYDLPPEVFRERISRVFELFPRIKERLNQKAATLSGGERQMLAMSIGLMREPRILLFDEPTAGLSPKLAREVLDSIRSLNREGYTIILVEQNVKAALEIGDKGVLVVNGRIAFEGPSGELLARKDLAKMYLGLGG